MSSASAEDGSRAPAPTQVPAPVVPRHELLGTWVDGFTLDSLLDTMAAAISTRRALLIANHNLNSLSLLQRDAAFEAFNARADFIFIDGASVRALGRLLLREGFGPRMGVLDWIWPFSERAEREGWRVVHLGADEPVLGQARAQLLGRHPRLSFTTVPGFFDPAVPAENEQVLQQVRDARPDVLLVGMGMPRQERWLHDNLDALPPCVVVTVGGILGYLGGDRPTPPRWLGDLGLEWLYRLATEPRRLWRRYLVEPVVLVRPVLLELLRRRGPARTRRRPTR